MAAASLFAADKGVVCVADKVVKQRHHGRLFWIEFGFGDVRLVHYLGVQTLCQSIFMLNEKSRLPAKCLALQVLKRDLDPADPVAEVSQLIEHAIRLKFFAEIALIALAVTALHDQLKLLLLRKERSAHVFLFKLESKLGVLAVFLFEPEVTPRKEARANFNGFVSIQITQCTLRIGRGLVTLLVQFFKGSAQCDLKR